MRVFIRRACYGHIPGQEVSMEDHLALHLIRHGFADKLDDFDDEIEDGVYVDHEEH